MCLCLFAVLTAQSVWLVCRGFLVSLLAMVEVEAVPLLELGLQPTWWRQRGGAFNLGP